ncbi:hypothetical protein MPH_10517 [Macrophomina phaseolina MS6]|uniref:Uncharacterized protein n=1 Tax=Macrophomina phaseolina (strain MS6) TaxID=1126212 RepID=K2S6H2_MACPH|nr:hypothetical protein MPH_10517 [Macrophomina phaseolina MS6]
MPFLKNKLTLIKKKKNCTFAVLRRNHELLHDLSSHRSTTHLRAMIPTITNTLRPHPSITLEVSPLIPKDAGEFSLPSTSAFDLTDADTPTIETWDGDTPTAATATPALFVLPPSAVPWPPRVCAAPLSTHHRLRCGHVVRTPFLTPCGANCAHVSGALGSTTPALSFVIDAFRCVACVEGVVKLEAEGKREAFVRMLEGNREVVLEWEENVMLEAYMRIVVREMEGRRSRLLELGRSSEGAEERDGHARMCP